MSKKALVILGVVAAVVVIAAVIFGVHHMMTGQM